MKNRNVVVLVLCVLSTKVFANDNNTIDIGFISMLSGPGKVYGLVAANSAKLAIDEINKKGVNGKTLKLHIRDTNTSPATALSVTKNLMENDVDLIVGFHTSDERFAVKDYIESQNRLYLYTAIYEGRDWGKWTFYSGPIPNQIYDQSIEYITNIHDVKTVYLVGSDYSYAQISHEVLKKRLSAFGLELVGEKLYPFPTTQFDVSDIVAKKPDLIITNIVGEDDLLWTLELQKHPNVMRKAKVFSGLLQDPLLLIVEPEYIENFYSAYPFSRTSKEPLAVKYVTEYTQRFGAEFASVGQGVYDSILLLAEALRLTQTETAPEVLGQALLDAKVLGPRGQNVMESNHHVTMDINLVQGNKDKKYKIVKTFYNVKPSPEL